MTVVILVRVPGWGDWKEDMGDMGDKGREKIENQLLTIDQPLNL
jgi:hypothetical protein